MNEAENLFVNKLKTVETIAQELNLCRKTVMNWKEKGDWDYKRQLYYKSKITFHEEMYEFARKLMKEIVADMDEGNKVDASKMYTFTKLIPMFTKVKGYEDVVAKPAKEQPKGLTPDIIAQIEQDILGIPQQTES
ncbi:MAG: hypothetical protein IJ681_09275 [Bacteroidales bacterium]|nr:hypothetical protein [Bacteroidales bacterium]